MATKVTLTLTLPGRSRKDALRRASQKLSGAAWEDYPDRIHQMRHDGDLGYASTLASRCDLFQSLGNQLAEEASR